MVDQPNAGEGTLERKEDAGKGEAGQVKLWLLEWDLADKAEEKWRERVKEVIDIYEGEKTRHNILWANTETLRPTLYDTAPNPDVRRRFANQSEGDTPEEVEFFKVEDERNRDVSEIMERGSSYSMDSYDFDDVMSGAILDYLLAGRAVTRVKYIPTFAQTEVGPEDEKETIDEVVDESVQCEQVDWEDFRRGPAKKWVNVPWVGFIHKPTRAEMEKQFGKEKADKVELDSPVSGAEKRDDLDDVENQKVLKRGTVFEIWDKENREVLFLSPTYKDGFLKKESDPLELKDFFPIPRPLYSVDKPSSLIPKPEYDLYQELADELNEISQRIKNLVKMLKLTGFYDKTVEGIDTLMSSVDGTLIPATNAQRLIDNGGLQNAIFFMPIEEISKVLVNLYTQRDQTIQAIFEITGISDIVRGVSDPRETAKAQSIKSQFGSLRLKRRQSSVARYARDLIRMKAEIISEKFSPEILSRMTQKAVTPDILKIMREDKMREWNIDIETDSTIAGQQASDQEAITKLFTAIGSYVNTMGPAAQQGMIPVNVAATLLIAGIRKFKFGREVEDVLDKIKLPEQQEGQQQQGQGQPGPAQLAQQAEQQREQQAAQMEQQKAQLQAQLDQAKMQGELTIAKAKAQTEMEIARGKADAEIQLKREQIEAELALKREEMQLKHELELERIRLQTVEV